MPITQADIFDALREALRTRIVTDDGVTTRELAKQTNIRHASVLRWVREEIEAGRLESVRVIRVRCDGQKQLTSAYRPKA